LVGLDAGPSGSLELSGVRLLIRRSADSRDAGPRRIQGPTTNGVRFAGTKQRERIRRAESRAQLDKAAERSAGIGTAIEIKARIGERTPVAETTVRGSSARRRNRGVRAKKGHTDVISKLNECRANTGVETSLRNSRSLTLRAVRSRRASRRQTGRAANRPLLRRRGRAQEGKANNEKDTHD